MRKTRLKSPRFKDSEALDRLMSGRKRRYRRTIGTVDGCRTAGGQSSESRVSSAAPKKLDFDFGVPDPYPKDGTGRFAHVGRTCVAHEATGRREHKP